VHEILMRPFSSALIEKEAKQKKQTADTKSIAAAEATAMKASAGVGSC